MHKVHFLAAVMFAASFLVTPGRTQDTPKKGAALKPAPSASEALLANWNEIGRKLIAMAEDFPEDKYNFKPAPSARTFAERLLHAAAANYFFTNMALGQKPPSEEDPKRDLFKSKADLVAYVKKSFADGAAAIKSRGDQGISGVVVDPFAQDVPEQAGRAQIRLSDLAYSLVEHAGEVYGQLTVYYRVAGLIPPESRPKK
jgi:uncharacterized damage-inducible protein DinB